MCGGETGALQQWEREALFGGRKVMVGRGAAGAGDHAVRTIVE